MIFDKVHNSVNASVDGTSVSFSVAEVRSSRSFTILSYMQGVIDELLYTFIFSGGNRNYRNSEHLLHFIYTDCASVSPYLVHHIQSKYNRDIKLHKLKRKI